MRFSSLEAWLAWQATASPKEIVLGLERIGLVWERLGRPALGAPVITVAGTNGKGSSVAMTSALLQAAGLRVGAYTSPHIVDYNERIAILDGAGARYAGDDEIIAAFEQQEGMIWLRALEAHAIHRLLNGFDTSSPPVREKRPFAQALFCIDTRSERIRRHLEDVGDYQTFGIAGFFGVPVSFMELGKGSETHLCPVILTPKNLVPEITAATRQDDAAVTALEKAMHELKESVLTPFVTVEAIGLLFGFDMIGKTIAPRTYNRWRKRLHPEKPFSRLLLDKLSREQADSIVRAVQRTVIVKAVAAPPPFVSLTEWPSGPVPVAAVRSPSQRSVTRQAVPDSSTAGVPGSISVQVTLPWPEGRSCPFMLSQL